MIIGMTSSLDGFVADQSGRPACLYPDLAALRGTLYMNAAIEETGLRLCRSPTARKHAPDSRCSERATHACGVLLYPRHCGWASCHQYCGCLTALEAVGARRPPQAQLMRNPLGGALSNCPTQ